MKLNAAHVAIAFFIGLFITMILACYFTKSSVPLLLIFVLAGFKYRDEDCKGDKEADDD